MSEDRYYIDKRDGCIAIRDKQNTNLDDHGLHPETQGVTHYRDGQQKFEDCPTCKHRRMVGWEVAQDVVTEMEELCKKMNRTQTSERPSDIIRKPTQ